MPPGTTHRLSMPSTETAHLAGSSEGRSQTAWIGSQERLKGGMQGLLTFGKVEAVHGGKFSSAAVASDRQGELS